MTSLRELGNPRPRERQKRWIQLSLPCVGTSFRASAASGLSHSPPGSPVPPSRRVSHLQQNDRTYIYAFPDWEYVSAHASKASAYSVASRLCTLQCRAAEIPPETDVDASNPRPGAAAGSLSHGQSARSCRTRLKRLDKRLIVRHPSNSRGYIPLQKAHGTGSKMVGDGFKALSSPTRRQGGHREGGRNG